MDVYRKPTHTDRYLDFNSHHDKKHKDSTAATLLHRALNLPNTSEGKERELNHLIYRPKKTRPPPNLSPEELVGMFFNLVESTESRKSFASLPYIKGVTEPLTRVLKKYDISVTNKPMNTLQQQFPAPKFRPAPDLQTNVVYKIPCADCSWCYIGETGRAFNMRRKEHFKKCKNSG